MEKWEEQEWMTGAEPYTEHGDKKGRRQAAKKWIILLCSKWKKLCSDRARMLFLLNASLFSRILHCQIFIYEFKLSSWKMFSFSSSDENVKIHGIEQIEKNRRNSILDGSWLCFRPHEEFCEARCRNKRNPSRGLMPLQSKPLQMAVMFISGKYRFVGMFAYFREWNVDLLIACQPMFRWKLFICLSIRLEIWINMCAERKMYACLAPTASIHPFVVVTRSRQSFQRCQKANIVRVRVYSKRTFHFELNCFPASHLSTTPIPPK